VPSPAVLVGERLRASSVAAPWRRPVRELRDVARQDAASRAHGAESFSLSYDGTRVAFVACYVEFVACGDVR
jgi:hypothetical protein